MFTEYMTVQKLTFGAVLAAAAGAVAFAVEEAVGRADKVAGLVFGAVRVIVAGLGGAVAGLLFTLLSTFAKLAFVGGAVLVVGDLLVEVSDTFLAVRVERIGALASPLVKGFFSADGRAAGTLGLGDAVAVLLRVLDTL